MRDQRAAADIAQECGDKGALAVEKTAWLKAAMEFLHGPAGKTEKPAKASIRKIHRTKAYEFLLCLDNVLQTMCGKSLLDLRMPKDRTIPPDRWPVLTLSSDQGSDCYAGQWFLRYHCDVVVLYIRDAPHRVWNDVRAALKAAGLWGTVVLVTAVLNADHGPYQESRFWQQSVESIDAYLDLVSPQTCPIYASLRTKILRDRGMLDEAGRLEVDEEVWGSLREAFKRKTQRIGLSRWFGFISSLKEFLPNWNIRCPCHSLVEFICA